jgi:hypothetical protein
MANLDMYLEHGDYNKDPDELSRPYIRVYISPKGGFIETVTTTTTRLKTE